MSNSGPSYRFGDYRLDMSDRQLWKKDERIGLNSRYFDTLALLVRESERLIEKERFFDEVWSDVVVSDNALTQCIKEIRKQLGDDAATPRFIQTVPRHGYRFIAPVEVVDSNNPIERGFEQASIETKPETTTSPIVSDALWWVISGMVGGGIAGIFGGLLYGTALGYAPGSSGMGTASILLVVLSANVLVGLVGSFGICAGMATFSLIRRRPTDWSLPGAMIGGLLVGGLSNLLGVDAFTLFFGQAPLGITGGLEGAALGAAVVLGVRLALLGKKEGDRSVLDFPWRPVIGAGLGGALTGALIPIAGGHVMGGSLHLISQSFGGSRLELDVLARLFGEDQFGVVTEVVMSGVEGLLFGSCIVAAIMLGQRIRHASGNRKLIAD